MWYKIRFLNKGTSFTPREFPPPGPYWCLGYRWDETSNDNVSIIICYLKDVNDVILYWPHADLVEILDQVDKIQFTKQLPKPEWWEDSAESKD